MRTLIVLFVGLSLAATAAGCGKRGLESFVVEGIKLQEQKAKLLAKLKTDDDVRKHRAALEKLLQRQKKLKRDMEDYMEKMKKKYEDRGEKAQKDVKMAIKDMKPEVRKELDKLELSDLLRAVGRF